MENIFILATSPLAFSGFAAIGCFRASPYGGIYILKNYSKLTAKKSAIFFSKIQIFLPKPSPDQDWTNKKKNFSNRSIRSEEDRFHTYIQRYIDPSAIYKGRYISTFNTDENHHKVAWKWKGSSNYVGTWEAGDGSVGSGGGQVLLLEEGQYLLEAGLDRVLDGCNRRILQIKSVTEVSKVPMFI